MDPTACLRRILAAIVDEDREETIESLSDLLMWLDGGGFLPHLDRIGGVVYAIPEHYPSSGARP